jgi:hypothetical protein
MAGFLIIKICFLCQICSFYLSIYVFMIMQHGSTMQSVRDLIKHFFHFRQAQQCLIFSFRKNTEG